MESDVCSKQSKPFLALYAYAIQLHRNGCNSRRLDRYVGKRTIGEDNTYKQQGHEQR